LRKGINSTKRSWKVLSNMDDKIRIRDSDISYNVDYRNIKYPRLELKTGKLLLVLPKNYKEKEVLLEKHKDWIYEKTMLIKIANKLAKQERIQLLKNERFEETIRQYVERYSSVLGVNINNIRIRRMKSKWASCSPKRNITFNRFMQYLPEELIAYVALHEIAHLIERKHNKRFWSIVEKEFPDYAEKERKLFIYWFAIQGTLEI